MSFAVANRLREQIAVNSVTLKHHHVISSHIFSKNTHSLLPTILLNNYKVFKLIIKAVIYPPICQAVIALLPSQLVITSTN